jgi:hypothetical protein
MWHQTFGLVAVTIAATVLLHGWEAPRSVAIAFGVLGLMATVLFAVSTDRQTVRPQASTIAAYSEQMPPQAGVTATWALPRKRTRMEASAE